MYDIIEKSKFEIHYFPQVDKEGDGMNSAVQEIFRAMIPPDIIL